MKTRRCLFHFRVLAVIALAMAGSSSAVAAVAPLSFTVNLSEPVTVNTTGGTPTIAVDVGGVSRTATYSSGSGSTALTFTYTPTLGDIDLDGITVSSPIQLNGGTLKDAAGNNATQTFTPPNTSGVKIDYPSLSMDFVYDADGRYTLNGTAYNDLASFLSATGGTFSRASTASYVDSSGTLQTAASGAPRFDYDPITHTAKGLLIEGSRTNLFSKSSEFDAWGSSNVTVTPNATTAPDGTATADLLTANVIAANNGLLFKGITGTFNTYTFSLYAKAGNINHLRIQVPTTIDSTSTGYVASFDLSNTTATVVGQYGGKFSNLSATISSVGNGWYRCATTFTVSGTTWNSSLTAWIIPSFSGDSVGSNIYAWGAQLETGPFPTSYIPTTTAAVTRAADVLALPTGGWFNGTNGALFVNQFYTASAQDYSPVMGSSQSNMIGITYQGPYGNAVGGMVDGSFQASTGPLASSSFNKMAITNSATQIATSRNGGSVSTSTGKTITGATTLYLGQDFNATTPVAPKWAQALKFYPTTLSNTQLQLLTQ